MTYKNSTLTYFFLPVSLENSIIESFSSQMLPKFVDSGIKKLLFDS